VEHKDKNIFTGTGTLYLAMSCLGYDSSKRAKTASKKELKKNRKIAMDFLWEGLPNPVR
jgi:hypothetical protein